MKENSYTKGEWKYSQYYFDDARGSIFMDNKEGACTIELRGAMAMSQEELNSHAQLIATAPELLEACKRGLETLEILIKDIPSSGEEFYQPFLTVRENIKQAINKAEKGV